MDRARQIEGRKFQVSTTIRTNELIAKLNKRKGNQMEALLKQEMAEKALNAKREALKSGNPLLIAEAEQKEKALKKKSDEDLGLA